MFDYDGTLTPLRDNPDQATLSPATRRQLQQLARQKGSRVGVVSGRRIHEIRRLVGLPHLMYVGNHGFEIQGARGAIHSPAAGNRLKALQTSAPILTRLLQAFPGSWVENKKWTLSIHYRRLRGASLNRFHQSVKRRVLPLLRMRGLSVCRGHKVIDVRPSPAWNKGTAVRWLRRQMPSGSPTVFFGDDLTDEQVFQELRGQGLTVRIGQKPSSRAAYYLRSQKQMGETLDRLLRLGAAPEGRRA
ncbi:MAG: trehalose-phosphatase [Elusimicrobia bacterium RIFCSPLOWO2_01_FULL_59_12]|nr:MAG: trehalose-phosphatase [Elusimicrobia bacterium RIFCSPLOWO2_01_FULL_59_12]